MSAADRISRLAVIARDVSIDAPSEEEGLRMALPYHEWERLRVGLSKVPEPSQVLTSAGWSLAGISASAFLAALALGPASVPMWQVIVAWCATTSSAIGALVCFYLSPREARFRAQSCSELLDQMNALQRIYGTRPPD